MVTALLGPGVFRTVTRRQVDLRKLTVDDVRIDEIAHSLSRQVRFIGHVVPTWSVASHSIAVADVVRLRNPGNRDLELAGLLHDANEAFLGDVMAPLKALIAEKTDVLERLASEIDRLVEEAFSLPTGILDDDEISSADRDVYLIEESGIRGNHDIGVVPADVVNFRFEGSDDVDYVRSRFMTRFRDLKSRLIL